MADDKTSYSDLDIRFSVGETGFHALNIIYERLERNIPGHSHGPGCYEIHYIAAGHGRVILQGQAHPLSPGSLYVTGPGVEHAQLSDKNDPMCEYCVYLRVSGKNARETHDPTSVAQRFLQNHLWLGQDSQNVRLLLKDLFDEFRCQHTGYMIQIQALLQQLPVKLVRCYEQGKTSAHHFSPSNLMDSNTVIIEEYFLYEYQTCTLEGLATRLGLSSRQTERLLKKQYDMTFVEKRTQARMSAASVLLLKTTSSITDIAAELGYSSVEHFANAFRRFYGKSAREYRKKAKTGSA